MLGVVAENRVKPVAAHRVVARAGPIAIRGIEQGAADVGFGIQRLSGERESHGGTTIPELRRLVYEVDYPVEGGS